MGFLSINFSSKKKTPEGVYAGCQCLHQIKITSGSNTRTWGVHVQKTCENIFEYQGLWVTNLLEQKNSMSTTFWFQQHKMSVRAYSQKFTTALILMLHKLLFF